MATRAAIYARVSTSEQDPSLQLDELAQYASARRLEVVGRYVDQGISGARAQRPQLDALVAAAKRREFDALLVWKLDRLARSVRHLTTLAGELEALGIDLIVPGQAIDTSTPTGRLLFNVLGSIAEFERDLIRDRVVAGMKAAQRRGKSVGRPERLKDDQKARITRLRRTGRSLREIATLIGVSKSTVARALEGERDVSAEVPLFQAKSARCSALLCDGLLDIDPNNGSLRMLVRPWMAKAPGILQNPSVGLLVGRTRAEVLRRYAMPFRRPA